ncbi:acyl-CoA synthetase [Arhodomonas sp. AD133]|uniref:acyl-CoA synthetase n=1 Tax=Arhodomonas sp. AD133 TaxID=3415009 RepID=UPI003EB7FD7A
MLARANDYDTLFGRFRWRIPARYNIGVDIVDRHAGDPDRLALVYDHGCGDPERYTFAHIAARSNRLANALRTLGVERGDRIGILLPQRPETAIAHVAAYKLGAIALPLFTLFGPDALEYRLADSGARVLITDHASLHKIAAVRDKLPALEQVISVDGPGDAGTLGYADLTERASDRFEAVATAADDPALIIYTSGTTGNPKGALHAHRVLLGHLPGVELPHDFFPQPGDLFWTPADWAWIGGLIDVLLPAWHHGVPVLAHRAAKFDPEEAFDLIARHHVRNAFLPPTALKLMRQVEAPRERFDLRMRSIGSGGETLGEGLLQWGRETFGLDINEFYGQTECNLVVANCASLMPVRPGAMGRAVPGHQVAVIDEAGNPVAAGSDGEIAVHHPDPVMFLGYWNNQAATQEKFTGDWLRTGDMGRMDADGYLWHLGRMDDVITSGGYRIGPAEVEDCLLKHPAVAMAAVIGSPDPVRTEVVKAFIVTAQGAPRPDDALAREIQAFVRDRLAAHEYPRAVEFVDELPLTTTGKVMRRVLRDRELARKG